MDDFDLWTKEIVDSTELKPIDIELPTKKENIVYNFYEYPQPSFFRMSTLAYYLTMGVLIAAAAFVISGVVTLLWLI